MGALVFYLSVHRASERAEQSLCELSRSVEVDVWLMGDGRMGGWGDGGMGVYGWGDGGMDCGDGGSCVNE